MSTGRKLTHSWITTARVSFSLSFFLSFATINSCVLYSPVYERRWICLTFLFPSRQTLDRVRGRKPKKRIVEYWETLKNMPSPSIWAECSQIPPCSCTYMIEQVMYIYIIRMKERLPSEKRYLLQLFINHFPNLKCQFWFVSLFTEFTAFGSSCDFASFSFLILRDEIQ